MARDDDRHRSAADRRPDGARVEVAAADRRPDLVGERPVGGRGPVRNLAQRVPDAPLEERADQVKLELEVPQLAGEVAVELLGRRQQDRV